MKNMLAVSEMRMLDVNNPYNDIIFKKEDYDEYLEWKSTLSDWELKEGFRFHYCYIDSELHIPTFSWYMKNRVQLKQYYEQINDWRKLKPNQFLKKTNVEKIDYNEWNW